VRAALATGGCGLAICKIGIHPSCGHLHGADNDNMVASDPSLSDLPVGGRGVKTSGEDACYIS